MFLRRDRHGRPRVAGSGGFTLIEVVVALGILSIVAGVLVTQVITGIRATATARDIAQAKGVAQGRLEKMRNMPYHVGRAAGEYIDVLDTYYRDLNPPSASPMCGTSSEYPSTTWTGYVSGPQVRCDYEPASGPFYRHVTNPVSAPGLGDFAMIVDTQFLTPSTPPTAVTPPLTYNSQIASVDSPAAQQVGVTVTVFYKTQSGVRSVTTYTQIENQTPMDPLLTASGSVTTLRVASTTSTSPLTSTLGTIILGGELYTGSRVRESIATGAASNATGQQVTAASQSRAAPLDGAAITTTLASASLPTGCASVCFGQSTVDNTFISASNGLPLAGTPTAPVRALLTPTATGVAGFQFNNDAGSPQLNLSPSRPMVTFDRNTIPATAAPQDCGFTGSNQSNYLYSTGFIHTTKGTTRSVTSCVTAQTGTVVLFPTDFAPNGVVRITVRRAAAACRVSTDASGVKTATATGSYNVLVEYWNGSSYTQVTVTDTNTSEPLPKNFNSPIGKVNGSNVRLSDYISSWRSLTKSQIVASTNNSKANVDLKPLVSIDTMPTRNGDAASVISLQVGALSCKADDQR